MAPPQQQSQGGDNSLAPFWILAGLFVFGWGIWYFAHDQISTFVLHIKFWEAKLINLFVDVNKLLANIAQAAPGSVSFSGLSNLSSEVGDYLKWPIAIILAILAGLILMTNPIMRYKKTYSMQSLVETEKAIWPQINPVANVDLVPVDIDEGPWAMALNPLQFAKKHRVIQVERVISSDNMVSQGKLIPVLKREDAYRVFALQVGKYWRGVEHLNVHTKALFAIFAARANRDRDGATKLLLQIAASTKDGKLNFAGVDELLKKHKDNKAVIKTTQRHAFVLTVMAAMLQLARTDGVLASADFLWLKPVDRPLWFMLNSIGRQTPFTEVGGPFGHWLAELRIGHKLMVPMVDEAVNGLEAALKEIIYVPDEDEEIEFN